MYKKCKVIMLPTEKLTKLFIRPSNNELISRVADYTNSFDHLQGNHLYITSDEIIKEGDWCFNISKKIIYKKDNLPMDIQWKKIIASTQYLELGSNKGYILPRIPEDFIKSYIEAYNLNKPITEVLVEYEEDHSNFPVKGEVRYLGLCKIKLNKDNTINIKPTKDSYTKEEVIRLLEKVWFRKRVDEHSFDSWIKENL